MRVTTGRTMLTKVAGLARIRGVRGRTAAPFWAVTGVHLAAQLAVAAGVPGASVVAPVSKALLMPALALVLADGLHSAKSGQAKSGQAKSGKAKAGKLPAWWPLAAAGVTFSWFGDLALIEPDLFLAGVGLFGIAQVAYAANFVAAGDPARTAGRPALLAPYAVWWLALAGFFTVTGGVSPFLFAVSGYGLALGAMAFLAHRVSPAVATGAGLFVLSDSLIGLRGAGLELPAHGFWVMLTYLAAQWLIVRGLVEAAGADVEEATLRSRTSATSATATPSG